MERVQQVRGSNGCVSTYTITTTRLSLNGSRKNTKKKIDNGGGLIEQDGGSNSGRLNRRDSNGLT